MWISERVGLGGGGRSADVDNFSSSYNIIIKCQNVEKGRGGRGVGSDNDINNESFGLYILNLNDVKIALVNKQKCDDVNQGVGKRFRKDVTRMQRKFQIQLGYPLKFVDLFKNQVYISLVYKKNL